MNENNSVCYINYFSMWALLYFLCRDEIEWEFFFCRW